MAGARRVGLAAAFALRAAALAAGGAMVPPSAAAPALRLQTVQVTATRFGEPVQEVPQSIGIVTGDSLRARGATDLRTALALLAGVSVAPGGDAGPAGAVPGLLGLREVDDFLLLIDGIPAGGAFAPPFEAISLVNVDRIEVLRGTAPVYFGTTAFAGTVNIVHYPAGRADAGLALNYGSHGTVGVSGAAVISAEGVKQSVSGQLSRHRLSDPRAGFDRAQASYRLATELGAGQARADVNVLALRQKPASPSPVDERGQLDGELSPDFNQNPDGAKLDTDRYQLVLGYDANLPLGRWGTTLSLTRSREASVRGFLVEDFEDAVGDNAAGFTQTRHIDELFFDTHLSTRVAEHIDLTFGLNQLTGLARQDSTEYTYLLPLDGGAAPSLAAGTLGDSASLHARRSFFGAYAQSRVVLSPQASVLVGLRWNQTHETRRATNEDGDEASQSQRNNRFSGSIGGRWQVWRDPLAAVEAVTLHANLGSTFQPAQIDFGPEAGFDTLLKPETQRSLSFGAKVDALDGRLDVDLSAFFVDFANQPLATQLNGVPALVAGGKQRYTGIEAEASWRPAPAWTLAAHASYSDARYRDFVTDVDGVQTQLSGKQLAMSSRVRAGAGLTYAPERGWQGSLTTTYSSGRYLDRLNTARVGGFNVVDASIGYRFQAVTLSLSAANLTNRRDAIHASELGEDQFYRMPARHLDVTLSIPMR
jgi:iron complex outermembrane recepter protein